MKYVSISKPHIVLFLKEMHSNRATPSVDGVIPENTEFKKSRINSEKIIHEETTEILSSIYLDLTLRCSEKPYASSEVHKESTK